MRLLLFASLALSPMLEAVAQQHVLRDERSGLYVQLREDYIIGYDNQNTLKAGEPLQMELMNHGFIDGGLGKEVEIVFAFSYEDGTSVAKPNDMSMSRISLGKHIVDKNQNYQLIQHRCKVPLTVFDGLAENEIYVQVFLFLDGKQVAKGKRYRSRVSEHVRDNPRN